MELRPGAWHMEAARVRSAASFFFGDPDFPPGTATLDCALVMCDVQAGRHPCPGTAASARTRATSRARSA
ncbi:hypothetical protein ACFRFL_42195 [Streptomyces sp. NPDC056708]|uniref:hypothetical protein n=1 Tax=unclassified Streptomyces TaxID=2593676 RepID=UPI002E108878|nr:hypothetical protein OG609_41915 [Streptomyces sp. NBC_01224]